MRYYLIHEDEEVVIDLIRAQRVSSHLISFEFTSVKESKIVHRGTGYIRKLSGNYFYSLDSISWKKLPKHHLPDDILFLNRHFKLYRGYKPSGISSSDEGALHTKMPGKVVKILVSEGQKVKKGDTLLLLEAMKMENEIKSSRDGVIKAIYVKENQPLDEGVLMLEIES